MGRPPTLEHTNHVFSSRETQNFQVAGLDGARRAFTRKPLRRGLIGNMENGVNMVCFYFQAWVVNIYIFEKNPIPVYSIFP